MRSQRIAPHALHHLTNRGEHSLLYVVRVRSGLRVIEHAVHRFVPALAEHPGRWYVGHHVVRIAGGDQRLSGILTPRAESVIDRHLSSQREQGQGLPEPDGLQRVVEPVQIPAGVQRLQHHFATPDLCGNLALQLGFEVLPRSRGEAQLRQPEGGADRSVNGSHPYRDYFFDFVRQRVTMLPRQLQSVLRGFGF